MKQVTDHKLANYSEIARLWNGKVKYVHQWQFRSSNR